MGEANKLENLPLFVRPDETLDGIVPLFTEREVNQILEVHKETYNIFGSYDQGNRYYVTLPRINKDVQICRVGEGSFFYGDGVTLVNEYMKEHPKSEETKWIQQNARDISIARHYWRAINMRKKAEFCLLAANMQLCDAKAYIKNGKPLTEEEHKQLIIEFGYDPDRTYGV